MKRKKVGEWFFLQNSPIRMRSNASRLSRRRAWNDVRICAFGNEQKWRAELDTTKQEPQSAPEFKYSSNAM
jgi:hypothetical protein